MSQGLYLSITLIISFMVVVLSGLYLLSAGAVDMESMTKYFEGVGVLAGIFGIGPIITAYVITRGQTSGGTE